MVAEIRIRMIPVPAVQGPGQRGSLPAARRQVLLQGEHQDQAPAADTIITLGPGLEPPDGHDSWVTTALTRPYRLLEPLR
jgi:hypothetical protein